MLIVLLCLLPITLVVLRDAVLLWETLLRSVGFVCLASRSLELGILRV